MAVDRSVALGLKTLVREPGIAVERAKPETIPMPDTIPNDWRGAIHVNISIGHLSLRHLCVYITMLWLLQGPVAWPKVAEPLKVIYTAKPFPGKGHITTRDLRAAFGIYPHQWPRL